MVVQNLTACDWECDSVPMIEMVPHWVVDWGLAISKVCPWERYSAPLTHLACCWERGSVLLILTACDLECDSEPKFEMVPHWDVDWDLEISKAYPWEKR